MKEAIIVILNANAGLGHSEQLKLDVIEKFRAHGVDADVTLAADGAHMVALARAAVEKRAAVVVAGGGDGTINAVAAQLVHSETALGVLPLGTLNHFAKDLRLPLDIDSAIRTIAEGVKIRVDTAEVNGQIFINNSGLGLYPNIVRSREQQQRRFGRSKWMAFFWATINALRRYPFLRVHMCLDGIDHEHKTAFVFIGNNDYSIDGLTLGTRQKLTDGLLSVFVAPSTGRLGLLGLAVRALFGHLRESKDFDALTAKELIIESRHKKLRVSTDGEVTMMQTPLRYQIHAASLAVFVNGEALPTSEKGSLCAP